MSVLVQIASRQSDRIMENFAEQHKNRFDRSVPQATSCCDSWHGTAMESTCLAASSLSCVAFCGTSSEWTASSNAATPSGNTGSGASEAVWRRPAGLRLFSGHSSGTNQSPHRKGILKNQDTSCYTMPANRTVQKNNGTAVVLFQIFYDKRFDGFSPEAIACGIGMAAFIRIKFRYQDAVGG